MATCACCGSTVFFGKRVGTDQYCNNNCLSRGPIIHVSRAVPDHLVRSEAEKIFTSPCPVCRKSHGPTDLHYSHTIWSALVLTSWNSQARFSCKPCSLKKQSLATAQSLVLGWWGFPWGILGTPVTVVRNFIAMGSKIGATAPSKDLFAQTRVLIAAQHIENERLSQAT